MFLEQLKSAGKIHILFTVRVKTLFIVGCIEFKANILFCKRTLPAVDSKAMLNGCC